MTIDERIEALTQSVELLSLMHQDNEKKNAERFDRLVTAVEGIAVILERHDKRLDDLERKVKNGGL